MLSEAGTVSAPGPSENPKHDSAPKRSVKLLCIVLPVLDVNTPPKSCLFSLLGSAHSQRWSPAVHPAPGPDGHQRPDEGSRRGGAAAAREWILRWRRGLGRGSIVSCSQYHACLLGSFCQRGRTEEMRREHETVWPSHQARTRVGNENPKAGWLTLTAHVRGQVAG